MLKNIFVPEKLGGYFIFPQRILGFELSKTRVTATQIYISGKRNTVIEKYYEEYLEANNGNYSEKVTNSIKNIISKSGKYNAIRIALPSYLSVTKELTLPFLDQNKIRMVLNFELGATLPFPIEEAVMDFIVTKKDIKKKETTILAFVARKKDIIELMEPFKNAGLQVAAATVDILGLYGIYKSLPENMQNNNDAILLNIEFNHTNIAYWQKGQLRSVRGIQYGISHMAKALSDEMHIDPDKALEYILRFGLEDNENTSYKNAANKILSDFMSNLEFTLNSFRSQFGSGSDISKIFLIGYGNDIKNLCGFIQNKINITCQSITISSVLENNNFKLKEKILPNANMVSFAIAYPAHINEDFNLLRNELAASDMSLIKKQAFTLIFLVAAIFGSIITYSYLQTRKLKNEVVASKNQVITNLKNAFAITDPYVLKNLSEVIQTANNKVNEEENIWFAFSRQTRFSFLKYLQELSSIIDAQDIGLKLKKLIISEGTITLEGEVSDFKALETLENELNESKLFSHVSVPQETKFSIKMTIKKNEDDF